MNDVIMKSVNDCVIGVVVSETHGVDSLCCGE